MSNNNNVNSDKMNVFRDFQQMWVLKFPKSSLSDGWESDVRASLQRHKQKISDLTKELEQETLYVEYLERLLSDVEKFRQSGGDIASIFDEVASIPASNENADEKQVNSVAKIINMTNCL